ncbi:hypothetical protein SXCC_01195 [Gluconacetobacter sp. SXCC-1]|nr:hypothetical protein SXCC_01195 [Gluconacetobacter sp. SXCC-1]
MKYFRSHTPLRRQCFCSVLNNGLQIGCFQLNGNQCYATCLAESATACFEHPIGRCIFLHACSNDTHWLTGPYGYNMRILHMASLQKT